MAYEFVKVEQKGHITYVTINRPEVMNCLHAWANKEMSDIFNTFRDDDEQWVAIITGAGERAFSAGNDLKATADMNAGRLKAPDFRAPFGGITSNYECYKPIICAVNGYALGGGCEITLASDIIIAADHAQFGLPEPRVGLIAGAGGVHRLPRQVPIKQAMGMMLTAHRITAAEAYRMGLVNEVVPLANLMETADKWANEILECAPLNVRASKESAYRGILKPVDEAMKGEYFWVTKFQNSEDRIEGPKAFAEKRKPNWKGR